MRMTPDLKRLTNLILAAALAFACVAAARAGQVDERGAKPTASAASLLATLKANADDPSPNAARARAKAVEELRRSGQAAVPAITKFLRAEKKGPARVYAATALADIDPTNALARRTLDDIARNGKGDEVSVAAMTLSEIDPENEAAVPALFKMASKSFVIPSQENWDRLLHAAYALAQTAAGIRALTPLLGHWDPYVRRAAVFAFDDLTETLRHATPSELAAVREAIPALVKALADEDEVVRGMAAEELEQIGADAVPELKKAAAGDNEKLATAAAALLEEMGES